MEDIRVNLVEKYKLDTFGMAVLERLDLMDTETLREIDQESFLVRIKKFIVANVQS